MMDFVKELGILDPSDLEDVIIEGFLARSRGNNGIYLKVAGKLQNRYASLLDNDDSGQIDYVISELSHKIADFLTEPDKCDEEIINEAGRRVMNYASNQQDLVEMAFAMDSLYVRRYVNVLGRLGVAYGEYLVDKVMMKGELDLAIRDVRAVCLNDPIALAAEERVSDWTEILPYYPGAKSTIRYLMGNMHKAKAEIMGLIDFIEENKDKENILDYIHSRTGDILEMKSRYVPLLESYFKLLQNTPKWQEGCFDYLQSHKGNMFLTEQVKNSTPDFTYFLSMKRVAMEVRI